MNAISNSGNFCARPFCMSLIFEFLKISVSSLFMQALQHSGAWGDNSTPFFLDNNEDYAFISIK